MMLILAIVLMSCNNPKEIDKDGVYDIIRDDRVLMTIDTVNDRSIEIMVYKDMVCYIEYGHQFYTCLLDAELERRD
jgi:hypothetical protein